jgi:hypothetical protein
MPCPYFEPLETIATADLRNARLPLIEEYAGQCRGPQGDYAARAYHCNHGYARGACDRFPAAEKSSAHRFSLIARSPEQMDILFIREEDYAPAGTQLLHFSISNNRLVEADIDSSIAAQASAFCRSYLKVIRVTRQG